MFIKDFFDCIKGILDDTVDLGKEIKEVNHEYKRDMIKLFKDETPMVGNTIEAADKLYNTIKNILEQIPLQDKHPKPFAPLLEAIKMCEPSKTISPGQHLKVNRIGYSHHALAINEYEVIHYQDGEVKIQSLESFCKFGGLIIVDTVRLYPIEQVLGRAYSRLGERKYNLLFNNCEHFVLWALHGE